MAGRPDRSGSVRAGARGRALVLGGGGFLGALYEIGCLRALERRGGPGALDFDFVVGTSGGAVVAALLAAGYRPGELYENARSFSPSELCRLDFRALVRVSARFPYHFLRNLFRGIVRGSSALVEFQEVVQQAVPSACSNGRPWPASSAIGSRRRGSRTRSRRSRAGCTCQPSISTPASESSSAIRSIPRRTSRRLLPLLARSRATSSRFRWEIGTSSTVGSATSSISTSRSSAARANSWPYIPSSRP